MIKEQTNEIMKAIISELWETGIEIITNDNKYDDEIQSFSDLRKCENVLVGQKVEKHRFAPTEVMIDDQIVYVSFRNASHPTGCGKVRICEIQ